MKRSTKKKAQDKVMQGTFDDRLKYSNCALDTNYRVSTTIRLPSKQGLYELIKDFETFI